jgi:dTDP-4-dehydrorhamnose reductase
MGGILILGAGGRLGAALARSWSARDPRVIRMDRTALSIDDPDTVRRRLQDLDFDVLVNCAALTNVDYCETHREEAFRINAESVGAMADVCAQKKARLIHVSTDYVFEGSGRSPYSESDAPTPISVYGESKLAGEEFVLGASLQNWVVRVSWVFGPDRISFVDQVILRALKESRVEAVADKWATPTYTLDVCANLWPFLREIEGGGLVHVSNAGVCSWQEYGQHALDCALEAGCLLKAKVVEALKMAELKAFVAKRPVYSAMATQKLAALTGVEPRDWRASVREHVFDMAGRGAFLAASH